MRTVVLSFLGALVISGCAAQADAPNEGADAPAVVDPGVEAARARDPNNYARCLNAAMNYVYTRNECSGGKWERACDELWRDAEAICSTGFYW